MMHGQGTYKYKNGDKYVGQWVEDKKQGKGRFFYHDGEFYDGEWDNNKKNGYGAYYYLGGERYVGQWHNNSKWGRGTLYYNNFSEFQGFWVQNKKSGKGTFTDQGGNVTQEEWKMGSLIRKNQITRGEKKEPRQCPREDPMEKGCDVPVAGNEGKESSSSDEVTDQKVTDGNMDERKTTLRRKTIKNDQFMS
jgi:hypothetical protein